MTRKRKGMVGEEKNALMWASWWWRQSQVSSCFSLFCNRFHLKHNQTIKRAFVVLSKTLDNTLGWLTRVLWGWSSSSSSGSSSNSSWCDCGFAGVVGVGRQRKERKRKSVGEWGGGWGASSRGGCGARWPCGRWGTRSSGLRTAGRCRGRTWRSCSSAGPDTPDTWSADRRGGAITPHVWL